MEEEILKQLNKKFDEYTHKYRSELQKGSADYYMFLGKAYAFGEMIDLLKPQKL